MVSRMIKRFLHRVVSQHGFGGSNGLQHNSNNSNSNNNIKFADALIAARKAKQFWSPQTTSDEAQLNEVERFALGLESFPCSPPAILKSTEITTPKLAMELLCDIGIWRRGESRSARRGLHATRIPRVVEEAVKEAMANPIPDRMAAIRRDLSHLTVYTIDNSMDAADVDDAISIDESGWLYVHIADVARYVEKNSTLYQAAQTKVETLYLPEIVSPVFPDDFQMFLSILPGRKNAVTTVAMLVDEHGDIAKYEVYPALVSNVVKLTYSQADSLIENGSEVAAASLRKIREVSNLCYERRIRNGAFNINRTEAVISLKSTPTSVDIQSIAPLSQQESRKLVENCMVLAGEAVGKFFVDQNSVGIYRCHKGLAFDHDVLTDSLGKSSHSAADFLIGSLTAGSYSHQPHPHRPLGVDQYCHVTSPIRRYPDLVVCYQLQSILLHDSKLAYSEEEMKEISSFCTFSHSAQSRQKRLCEREWLIRYLMQKHNEGKVLWPGQVVNCQSLSGGPLTIVLLTDFGITEKIPMATNIPPKIGSNVKVRVHKIADGEAATLKFTIEE